ncbi:Proteinase inhibitor I3 [Forsythia ovata]|uniref:Proteinase inhibitor I3 n=1 Tax=Forsythia ovata TaxID=205694 RepID=A0ABD1X011_9LAMI
MLKSSTIVTVFIFINDARNIIYLLGTHTSISTIEKYSSGGPSAQKITCILLMNHSPFWFLILPVTSSNRALTTIFCQLSVAAKVVDSGLTLGSARNRTCPLDVIQEKMELNKGLPVKCLPCTILKASLVYRLISILSSLV